MKSKALFITILCACLFLSSQAQQRRTGGLQDSLLHKDYRPQSIFNTSYATTAQKAKYPAIDMHMHAPRGNADLEAAAKELINNMNECGIEKTILFCGTGKAFDDCAASFGKYPDRVQLWCGLDLTGSSADAIKELERCVKKGAKGVGEMSDKGSGLLRGDSPSMHMDDPKMDPILDRMAELALPMNFHCGDPKWMYEKMDAHNDLLFESYYFRLDNKKNILNLEQLIGTLENTLKKHPKNIIICPHFINQTYNLNNLGKLLDKYPNLYTDVSQRESYVAAIPRFAKKFIEKYADRIVYGTDQGYSIPMYRNTFHIWQTEDEHFYAWDVSNTPWPLSGLGLNDATLKKLYRDNALKLIKK